MHAWLNDIDDDTFEIAGVADEDEFDDSVLAATLYVAVNHSCSLPEPVGPYPKASSLLYAERLPDEENYPSGDLIPIYLRKENVSMNHCKRTCSFPWLVGSEGNCKLIRTFAV